MKRATAHKSYRGGQCECNSNRGDERNLTETIFPRNIAFPPFFIRLFNHVHVKRCFIVAIESHILKQQVHSKIKSIRENELLCGAMHIALKLSQNNNGL
jgi:hypothetical protein